MCVDIPLYSLVCFIELFIKLSCYTGSKSMVAIYLPIYLIFDKYLINGRNNFTIILMEYYYSTVYAKLP